MRPSRARMTYLYTSPWPTPGRNPDQMPESLPCSQLRPGFQLLALQTTETSTALGAQTAKFSLHCRRLIRTPDRAPHRCTLQSRPVRLGRVSTALTLARLFCQRRAAHPLLRVKSFRRQQLCRSGFGTALTAQILLDRRVQRLESLSGAMAGIGRNGHAKLSG